MRRRHDRGYTLVELLAVTAIAGVLAGIALPSYQSHVLKSRRIDGIAALMRLELAQNRFQANNGWYAGDLRALGAVPSSSDGHYAITLVAAGPVAYTASAEPAPGSPQARDTDCAPLTLRVDGERVERGPSLACWSR